jgi:cystathionine beta-synthase
MSTILPDSSLALIGGTPILRLTRFDTGPCELFLKLENQNPGGSIKDRVGLSMIEAAERDGHLWPGALIVEATAGNTGLGLAQVAARKGYPLLLVVPDKMSREKILHLRALGAEVVVTRSDVGKGHPEFYQDLAQRLADERRGYYVNQFENPANPLAHERGTGPELWAQREERMDAVVVGVGSGGTLTGLSRYFARVQPELERRPSRRSGRCCGERACWRAPRPAGSSRRRFGAAVIRRRRSGSSPLRATAATST